MRWFCAACVACAIAAPPRDALAQDADSAKARAKEAFQAGVTAYEAKHYEDALVHFEEAQRLSPHPVVQVNIANCYDKLERPIEAIQRFEAFLGSGRATDEQRTDVTLALRRLRGKIGRVLLRIEPAGAEVRIDGGEARRAPITSPVPLTTGEHTVEVRHDGYLPATRPIRLAAGAVQELEVRLEPATAPAPTPPPVAVAPAPPPGPIAVAEPPPTPEADTGTSGRIPTGAWVSGGVTALLVVSATVTGLLALDAAGEFEDQKSLRFSSAPELTASQRLMAYHEALDAAERAHGLALATDVLLGAAVVGAGITVYLYLTGRERDSALGFAPRLARDGAGATLRGRW